MSILGKYAMYFSYVFLILILTFLTRKISKTQNILAPSSIENNADFN
jgi:hypothetical protein